MKDKVREASTTGIPLI